MLQGNSTTIEIAEKTYLKKIVQSFYINPFNYARSNLNPGVVNPIYLLIS